MPIQVFGQGATQTAYVSYLHLDIQNRDIAHPERLGSITLLWPTSYVDAPYYDIVNSIQYEIIPASLDVNTAAGNTNTITLPNATEASVGANCIIRNVGAANFTILKQGGTPVQIAMPDIAYWLLLTDNSTAAGTWQVITFGAGTSQASAAALAGYGLYASGDNKLNTWIKVFDKNIVPILDETYSGSIIVWQGNTGTISLPAVGTLLHPQGYYLSFNNQGEGAITLQPAAGTIDNKPSISVDVLQTLTVICDGTNWWTLGFGLGQTTPFIASSKVVTGGVNVFLTPAQSLDQVITFTGALTADIIVGVYHWEKYWVFRNNTSGNFTLSVQLADQDQVLFGNQYVIPPNTLQTFFHETSSTNFFSYPTSLNSLTIDGGDITVNNNDININSGELNIDTGNINLTNGRSLFPNGTPAAPAYSFTGYPTSGIYHSSSSDVIRISIANSLAASFQKTGTQSGLSAISSAGIQLSLVSDDTLAGIVYNGISAIGIGLAGNITLSSPLPINSGGTNAITKAQAALNILPTAATVGDIAYYNGTNWVILAAPTVSGAATAYLKITKATGVPFWSDT